MYSNQQPTLLFRKTNFRNEQLCLFVHDEAAVFSDINQAVQVVISMAWMYSINHKNFRPIMVEPEIFVFQVNISYRQYNQKNAETGKNELKELYTILSVYNMGDKACIYSQRQTETGVVSRFLTANDIRKFQEHFTDDKTGLA